MLPNDAEKRVRVGVFPLRASIAPSSANLGSQLDDNFAVHNSANVVLARSRVKLDACENLACVKLDVLKLLGGSN